MYPSYLCHILLNTHAISGKYRCAYIIAKLVKNHL